MRIKRKNVSNWTDISKNTLSCIYSIVVYYENEILSQGTGTCISPNGILVTARHVINPIDDFSEIEKSEKIRIEIFNPQQGHIRYQACYLSYSIQMQAPFDPFELDLCLICPILSETKVPYFEIDTSAPILGENVLLAGYSEEIPFPLKMAPQIKKGFSRNTDTEKKIVDNFLNIMKSPAVKHGIISNLQVLSLGEHASGWMIHVDNGMHGGSSGGPIIRENGRLIGIITERSIVKINILVEDKMAKLEVPSGNSYGLTLGLLEPIST